MPPPSLKRSFAGFPDNAERHARGDRKNIDNAAKRAGWDRQADVRALARDLAQIACDHPPIWRAVIDLAAALHARYWPMALDERWSGADEAGEHTGVMTGEAIEQILRRSGVHPGCLGYRDLGRSPCEPRPMRLWSYATPPAPAPAPKPVAHIDLFKQPIRRTR
jgi:hypothetical protein